MSIFRKSFGNISSFIKIGQDWRLLYMYNNIHIWSCLAKFFLGLKIFHTNAVAKIKTHFMFTGFFFPPENRAFGIMWKSIADTKRSQMTMCGMRFAYHIPKITKTLSEYVIQLCQYNSCCTEAPQGYVTRTLSVLYKTWPLLRGVLLSDLICVQTHCYELQTVKRFVFPLSCVFRYSTKWCKIIGQ
jgi:hypothetical protein